MSAETAKDPGYKTELTKETAYVMAYRPDYSMKRNIGVDVSLSDIFTAEKIAASNKIIEIGRNCFFMDAEDDVGKLSTLIADDSAGAKVLPMATMISANLKGEAELYGFRLIYKICALMTAVCDGREKLETKLALMRDLAQGLASALSKKTKDDGGEEGKALLSELSQKCLPIINSSNP